MAYNVTNEEIALFRSRYRQTAKITIDGIEKIMNLTEADIVMGGLSVDRYCFSSTSFEIGTAISSELTLELSNADGRFDKDKFDGAKITVAIGVKKWDSPNASQETTHYVPLGKFTVDDKEKKKSSILLKALDDMVKFDKPYQTDLAYPASLAQIASDACNKCGVPLQTEWFYNSAYMVNTKPTGNDITFRQVIQWVAQISATNAFIDWNGKLNFKFFEDSGIVVPKSDRYESDVAEESAVITGVKVTMGSGESALSGSEGTVLVIEGNGLIQSAPASAAENIFAKVGSIEYLPYRAKCRPMPYLYPMDMITFEEDGVNHKTIVSNVTYTINGATSIAGNGQGKAKGGYASMGSVTTQERAIIESVKQEAETADKDRIDSALQLNQIISSAFGLYRTEVKDGKVSKWYFHDKGTLGESGIIYTFNAGGFAWTDNWNNGNPVWKYGFTQDGNAIFKILSTYKIQAEYIDATNLKVDAANITGSLTVGQLPDNLAVKSDIPTNNNQLTNGAGYQTETGVVTLVEGKITADYVNALGITVKSANIENGSITNLKIGDKAIGGFSMTAGQLNTKYQVSGSQSYEYAGISSITPPYITSPSDASMSSLVRPKIGSSFNFVPVRFFAGAPVGLSDVSGKVNMSKAKFAVLEDGSLYAKAAKIEGDISSSGGNISASNVRSTGNLYAEEYVDGKQGRFQNVRIGYNIQLGNHTLKSGGKGSVTSNYQIKMKGYSITGKTVTFTLECYSGSSKVKPKTSATGEIWFNYLAGLEMGYAKVGFTLSAAEEEFTSSPFSNNLTEVRNVSFSPTSFSYVEETKKAITISTNFVPSTINGASVSSSYSLGSAYAHWSDVYATNGTIQTSDRNQKNTILPISDKYSMLFDKLKPVSFKFNEGESGRTHMGLISQDVEESMRECGIETKDFAGFIKSHDDIDGTDSYSLRYTEFIPMCIKEIQRLKSKIKELEVRNNGT